MQSQRCSARRAARGRATDAAFAFAARGETLGGGFIFDGQAFGAVGGFRCKLNDEPWQACDSPLSYSDVAEGSHTLQVEATDPRPPRITQPYALRKQPYPIVRLEEEAEARRDRDAKAKGREEVPEWKARSTACSVTQFGLYCEPEDRKSVV